MRLRLWGFLIIFFISANVSLTSCMYSSATMTGAEAIYNRHNLQKKWGNRYLAFKAYQNIYLKRDDFKNTHVSVAAFNDTVLITGQVSKEPQKKSIVDIVKNLSQDREVFDFIQVMAPTSRLTRLSDSWITTKIKSQFVAANEIDPGLFKVITENGVVFLMGTIPVEQAEVAVDIARSTSGVQEVVKLFSYLHISKT